MSFSFLKNKHSLSFVFDIRDVSISLAAVRFEIDKKPEIILCRNFEFKNTYPKNYNNYLSTMIKTLDEAILAVRKDLIKIGNKEDIGAYYFFIGSPWSVSQSKTIKIIKDKPFEITNSFLEKIIASEEFSIEKYIEQRNTEPDWKLLEEKIIQSKINGYKVDDIYGKKTSNFALELFVSFIPFQAKDKMASYLNARVGKHSKRQNNSCIISSYSFFRDLYSNKNDFIYVDMGKIITDVYVVRDDIVFGVASIPFGEENIIQESLSRTNLSREIFMSHISIGQDKKFDLSSHNNGEDLLKTGFDLFRNKLNDTLSQICTEMNIPNNMFIIPNSIISSIFVKELSDIKNNKKFEILGSKIEVTAIREGVMNNLVLNGKIFTNEPYIKMDLVFLDKLIK